MALAFDCNKRASMRTSMRAKRGRGESRRSAGQGIYTAVKLDLAITATEFEGVLGP